MHRYLDLARTQCRIGVSVSYTHNQESGNPPVSRQPRWHLGGLPSFVCAKAEWIANLIRGYRLTDPPIDGVSFARPFQTKKYTP
jgi:hypothetical protein